MELKRIRQIVQAVAFATFILFLVRARGLLQAGAPVELFQRMSPFAALAAAFASKRLLAFSVAALVVAASAVVAGRFFCGWICPLGTTLDVTDRFLRPLRRKEPLLYDRRRAKYYLLALLLLLALLGVPWAGWLDPLSIATRSYGLVLHPLVSRGIDEALGTIAGIPVVGRVAQAASAGAADLLDAHPAPTYRGHGVLLLLFAAIVMLGLFRRRYWCRNLCPLGALLALLGTHNLLRRRVSQSCTRCGRCPGACGMGAIPQEDPTHTLAGECILCMDCRHVCPQGAVSFGRRQPPEQREKVDLSRRWLIGTTAGALVLAPAARVVARAHKGGSHPVPIRPPGALPERDFVASCIRCGECMRICPTNGLQPAGLETGLDGLWTPRLVPRLGPCDYRCNRCTQVCPTGAIRPLELPEKQRHAIGLARVNRSRCIPWVGSEAYTEGEGAPPDCNCGVCEEFCPVPTKAIRFNIVRLPGVGEVRRPYVVESLCVGCGSCENVCPVPGEAAIRVEGRQQLLEPAQDSPLARLFPLSLGGLVRLGTPQLYEGKGGLWDYIDGGADPYLTYAFRRAGVCRYQGQDGLRVKLDIWEFANTADAFGVHSLDRAGGAQKVELGDGAAALDDGVWMWKDRYAVTLLVEAGRAGPGQLVGMMETVSGGLPAVGAKPPALLERLPAAGRMPLSEVYVHSALAMTKAGEDRDTYLAEQPLLHDVLGEGISGVMAQYEVGTGARAWIFVASPGSTALAERFRQARREWGQTEETVEQYSVFSESDGLFAAQTVQGDLFLCVFRAPSRAAALDLIRLAHNSL